MPVIKPGTPPSAAATARCCRAAPRVLRSPPAVVVAHVGLVGLQAHEPPAAVLVCQHEACQRAHAGAHVHGRPPHGPADLGKGGAALRACTRNTAPRSLSVAADQRSRWRGGSNEHQGGEALTRQVAQGEADCRHACHHAPVLKVEVGNCNGRERPVNEREQRSCNTRHRQRLAAPQAADSRVFPNVGAASITAYLGSSSSFPIFARRPSRGCSAKPLLA